MNTSTRTGIGPQLAPCAATVLLVIAGAATHAAAGAGENPGGTALTVGGAAFVLAVLVSMKRGRRIECRKARARLRVLLLGSAAWLGMATATGITWGALQILAALMLSVSWHWWSARRIPNSTARVAAFEIAVGYPMLWAEHVARTGRPLAGSRLTHERITDAGFQYTLLLVPGVHARGVLDPELGKIRGALGLRRDHDMLVEPHPDLPEPHLRLTIVTRRAPVGATPWPGPQVLGADGHIALGPFVDGVGRATWKAFTKDRVFGGFLQGGTNAGKSRLIEGIGLALAASEIFPSTVIFADGQGGASSRMLKERADHTALTLDGCRVMLRGLIRLMEHRQDENDIEGWDGFTATATRRAVFLIMDECHKFFIHEGETQEDIQAMVAQIAREGGKVGVAVIAASQMATLAAVFGGGATFADAIRSNLLMGNGVMFRGLSKSARGVFRTEIDPTQFPDRPGYALLCGTGLRPAPFLAYFVSDEIQRYWLPRVTWHSLDTGSANAWGADYVNRRALVEAERAAKRARVEARRAGRPVAAGVEPEPVTRRVPATTSAPPSPWGPVRPFPVWRNPATAPSAPAAAPPMTEVARKVLAELERGEILHDGYARPSWLARRLGYTERHIHTALNELFTRKLVRKGDVQGHWYLTDKKPSREVA